MISTRLLLTVTITMPFLSYAMQPLNGPSDHMNYCDKRNAALINHAIRKEEQLKHSMSLFCKKCQSRAENKEIFKCCARMIQELDHLIRAGQRETHAAIRNQSEFLSAFESAEAMTAALNRLEYCDHGARRWA